jgi:hypothetical protein
LPKQKSFILRWAITWGGEVRRPHEMHRLIEKKIVEIPEDDPVIAYKKLTQDMCSPYRKHKYEIGQTYQSNCFKGNCLIEGFFTMHESALNSWSGDRLFEVAIWGKVLFINMRNIESEYMKILREIPLPHV